MKDNQFEPCEICGKPCFGTCTITDGPPLNNN